MVYAYFSVAKFKYFYIFTPTLEYGQTQRGKKGVTFWHQFTSSFNLPVYMGNQYKRLSTWNNFICNFFFKCSLILHFSFLHRYWSQLVNQLIRIWEVPQQTWWLQVSYTMPTNNTYKGKLQWHQYKESCSYGKHQEFCSDIRQRWWRMFSPKMQNYLWYDLQIGPLL